MCAEQNPALLDQKSNTELIELALTQDSEGDAYWDTVWELRKRPTRETFEAARDLCGSDDPQKRALGANILAQLGALAGLIQQPFLEESLAILLPMLDDPRNAEPELLDTIIAALGHQHDHRIVSSVVRYKDHPNANLRWSVAVSLGGIESDLAIAALIEMSRDTDANVRDWATFGLGTLIETDTLEIRTALQERLNDSDNDTRNEAIRGLAQRKDDRAIGPLIRELSMGNPYRLALEVACELGDPRLLPALLTLKEADVQSGIEDETLDEAIVRCQPAQP